MDEGDVRRRNVDKKDSTIPLSKKPKDAGDSAGEDEQDVEQFENELGDGVQELQGLKQHDSGLEQALEKTGISTRWRNWIVRGVFTMVMILFFSYLVYWGPLALIALVFIIQLKCFSEIINIGYCIYKTHDLPWFRSLSWYFLFASNYFFFGENLIDYFGIFMSKTEFLQPLVDYHRFISFTLYCTGIVWFVLSLVKNYYFRQFSMFAWTHIALLIVNSAAYFFVQNIFQGLIWFLVPVSMIICNDIMAYMFGFFFGKTPLIKLSPKKTWEGFIGGGLSTIVFGILMSLGLIQYSFFVCPLEYNEIAERLDSNCTPGYSFQLQQYNLPRLFQILGFKHIMMYPFVLHSIAMSVFSSVIGPFGGFFASGFKRAFKIKDFGDIIPGHGGIMDRFDCQILMACFVNVYIRSFIRGVSPQKLMMQVLRLEAEDQIVLYSLLRDYLHVHGLLPLADVVQSEQVVGI